VTSQAREAREALGARLREVRITAGLTGRALALAAGWHFTKVSKIEHGAITAAEDDIRAWCRACGAEDQAAELIETARAVETLYVEWRRQTRAGLKHFQDASLPLYERTSLFRVYEPLVMPGLLCTAAYAAAMFRFWSSFLDLTGDLDAAVAARMDRQKVLYTGSRRFVFVLEEQALRTRVGDAMVMAGQLDRLLAVTSLPHIKLGVIPRDASRVAWSQGNFWIFDDARVNVETVSAALTITTKREIILYERLFELLQRSAVYGRDASALISGALADLTAGLG
jgi:transcriptional regulator with XRE-family HTH domain